MEINFKEMELIAPALNRIADALELLAGKSNVTHARESAAADQPETPEEKPKKAASDDELTEQTMRKFAAEAVKKGLKKTPAIIKEITGGETRFADIDPALYPEIHEAISAALEEL